MSGASGRLRVAVWAPFLGGLGGGPKHGLMLALPLIGVHDVTVFQRGSTFVSPERLREVYGIDFSPARFERMDHEHGLPRVSRDFDLLLNVDYASLEGSNARRNILLILFPLPLDDYGALASKHGWFARKRQRFLRGCLELADRLAPDIGNESFAQFRADHGRGAALTRLPAFAIRSLGWTSPQSLRLGYPALDDYDVILSNSEYTAGWTQRNYGKASGISYPPIDLEAFSGTGTRKQNLAISVGRFVPGDMSKRHDVLVRAFRECYSKGSLRDWRLVIAGGTEPSPEFDAVIAELKRLAEGLPISIEINVSFSRLRELYADASVYMHAMGFGQDPERSPWSFEHFGMTTVEAMAGGCVPMVFPGGGQREIVTPGRDGYHWTSQQDLQDRLEAFALLSEAERGELRARVRARAAYFGYAEFLRRSAEVYRKLGVDCAEPDQLMSKLARRSSLGA